jgi:hypothetical protein
MSTLLLLLTTAHAAASGPDLSSPLPPPRPYQCGEKRFCLNRLGLVVSGTAFFYGRRKIPVSNGPTPAYFRYFQEPSCPMMTAPVSTPANGAQKSK